VLSCPPDIQEKIKKLVDKDVSHETFLKIETYLSFLKSESKKYNLVGPKELDRLWERHVLDSAQLFPFLVGSKNFADVGSGAGFPGVILSLLGASGGCLVESSQKKSVFLENVSRETGADFSVLNVRVENLPKKSFDRIVSRAMASIETLLFLTKNIYSPQTHYVFLKGERGEVELEAASRQYSFEAAIYPSITSKEGKIIEIHNLFF
jgi:16S rRNA (guanine527-N7)-methyltransferase